MVSTAAYNTLISHGVLHTKVICKVNFTETPFMYPGEIEEWHPEDDLTRHELRRPRKMQGCFQKILKKSTAYSMVTVEKLGRLRDKQLGEAKSKTGTISGLIQRKPLKRTKPLSCRIRVP